MLIINRHSDISCSTLRRCTTKRKRQHTSAKCATRW